MHNRSRVLVPSVVLPTLLLSAGLSGAVRAGEKLPPGPPWHVTCHEAKRDAIRHGKPVFVYFTKTY